MVWALETAVVDDAGQLLVLIALAERADDDGRNAWPGKAWLAQRARCSTRTVQRHLTALRTQNLVEEGDQRLVEHFRADRRPTVYNLVMTEGSSSVRRDNLSPRSISGDVSRSDRSKSIADSCGKPLSDKTSASPRVGQRGDTRGLNGETAVSPKPSLLPSEETATTTAAGSGPVDNKPEQQQRQRISHITDPSLLQLQRQLDAAGFDSVRWSGLTYAECTELGDLVDEHGLRRLVQTAQKARQAHARPPGHARAWLTLWRDLRSLPRAVGPVARCPIHSEALPCRGCAADAKASR
jgi:hypothetical protein